MVTVSIISISYGLIAWYGFPYILGDCKLSIQSYQGYSTNNVTFAIDRNMLAQNLDLNNKEAVDKLEHELEELVGHEIMAGSNVECMIDDDCHTKMDVCDREQTCQPAEWRPDANCAKGFDCETGERCNADGQCRPQEGSCGSKKDCPTGSFCDYGTCEKRVPHINAFGFKYGTIFYNPICKLINKDSDTLLASMQSKPAESSNLLHFYCEFIYEADAILHSLWRDEDWRDENYLKNNHEKIECQLFDLQFRPFQIDMVDLQILNGHFLKISDCDVEYSLVTTPGPPLPTSPIPDQTTSASNG